MRPLLPTAPRTRIAPIDPLDPKAANRAQVRKTILDHASAILALEGPHALSMRKLSEKVGASTIVLYTYFKDKQDILNELYREGFVRLQRDLEAVPAGADPMETVMALGRAYRRSAVANTTYYEIMFSQCVQGFTPSNESMEISKTCFSVLRDGVQRCMDAGCIASGSATHIAQVLWGTLHGVISLELFGYLGSTSMGEARLEQAIQTIKAGLALPSQASTTPTRTPKKHQGKAP
jgi:AcrR family transcriptional regulator